MTVANPYLWPARNKPVKLVYHPLRLGPTLQQLSRAHMAIGTALAARGYAYPPVEVTDQHATTRFGQDRVSISFPPTAPELYEQIKVCDVDWNARTLVYTEANAADLDRPGTHFYFDLHTGWWLVFTSERIPWTIGEHYESNATHYPAPQEYPA